MTYDPGIDVVVTNYRTPDDLGDFLRSYDDWAPDACSLSIINVCSTERDQEVASRAGALVYDTAENIGYARACNFGADLGSREVIAFFNADIVLTEGALAACHDALMSHDDWGVLGPYQHDGSHKTIHAGIFGTRRAPAHRGFAAPVGPSWYDVRDDAVTVAGSAYFIKRALWDELTSCELYQKAAPGATGAFLPTQLYYEETYCSYHATEHGYKVVYFGAAQIVHKWDQAVRKNNCRDWATKTFLESRTIFRDACDIHGIDHD